MKLFFRASHLAAGTDVTKSNDYNSFPLLERVKHKPNTADQILNMPPFGGEQTIQNPRKPPECIEYLPMTIQGLSEFILYTPLETQLRSEDS